MAEHQREKEVIKRRLAALAAESEPVREFIEQNVALFNGQPGDPRSFDLLDDLLEQQCYRLAYWRVAPDEINYRRFFDVNDLAALSMEREDVFEAAHGLVLRLLAEGKLDGLRIDHPDGLYDPAQYFRRLQEHYVLACARRAFEAEPAAPGRWTGRRWKARFASGSPPRLDRTGRPAGPAALRRGREDPRGRRVPGRDLGGPRHQRLRLPEPGQRPVRRPATTRAAFTRLYHDRVQDDTRVRRGGLSQEAADHAGVALQRAAHADAPARPAGPEDAAARATSPSTPSGRRCGR